MFYKKATNILTVIAFVLTFFIHTPQGLSDDGEAKISSPLQYSGYTSPDYEGYTYWSEYVPVSDGTQLAVAVYLPSNGPSAGPFPVVFWLLPGHRVNINPATGQVIHPQGATADFFTSYGYAFVIAEMRGSGASFGSRLERSPQIGKDGKDLVDWMAAQSWCDGNVGMVGASYQGFSQYATAGEKPAALKAIFPEIAAFDEYTGGLFYPGGIWNMLMTATAVPMIQQDDQNYYIPPRRLPSAPIVDEDGDGDLADEIPIDKNGNGTFLDDGLPEYSDGNVRENIYYNATLKHLENVNLDPVLLQNAPYRDSEIAGLPYTYMEQGPSYRPVTIAESGIAVYSRGGWFDYHARCSTQWFATLAETNPAKMLMIPSAHAGFSGPWWTYFGVEETTENYNMERLRFFDQYLKGIENGIDGEPPVYIYVMGEGWRFENGWPISRQGTAKYYFDEGNALAEDRTFEGSDEYQVDLATDARMNGQTRYGLAFNYVPSPPLRTDLDLESLTYTSEPLEKDLEITGHPIVTFWVSSTADDGDFYVYLSDVDEQGEAYFVTDGLLRANFADLVPNEDISAPGFDMDILPDLPWHGFKESDYVDGIFSGGNIVKLVIDLMPTSWVFKEGHQIRVSITGADYPTLQLHPGLSPSNDPDDPMNIVPTITVHHNAMYPSHIELPVIPDKPTVFSGTVKVKKHKRYYEKPAELYTFRKAVYLHIDDQWIKWKVLKTKETRFIDYYQCNGDLGHLSVLVKTKGSYTALASGKGVRFKGTANQ
ncbi:MAG: CocE/NonD family hydrolase [Deltaproteobacteria bacterium]|nr:CocE/NonD family hydrolase [Deltaproteobacteria bacterium]